MTRNNSSSAPEQKSKAGSTTGRAKKLKSKSSSRRKTTDWTLIIHADLKKKAGEFQGALSRVPFDETDDSVQSISPCWIELDCRDESEAKQVMIQVDAYLTAVKTARPTLGSCLPLNPITGPSSTVDLIRDGKRVWFPFTYIYSDYLSDLAQDILNSTSDRLILTPPQYAVVRGYEHVFHAVAVVNICFVNQNILATASNTGDHKGYTLIDGQEVSLPKNTTQSVIGCLEVSDHATVIRDLIQSQRHFAQEVLGQSSNLHRYHIEIPKSAESDFTIKIDGKTIVIDVTRMRQLLPLYLLRDREFELKEYSDLYANGAGELAKEFNQNNDSLAKALRVRECFWHNLGHKRRRITCFSWSVDLPEQQIRDFLRRHGPPL